MRIVNFHNVVSEPVDDFDAYLHRRHVNSFSRTLKHLTDNYEVLPLPVLLTRLEEGNGAPSALAITFDDGFAGVYDLAFPILAEAGVQASIFLITEAVEAGRAPAVSETRLLHFEALEIAFRLSRTNRLDASDIGLGCMDLSMPCERARHMHRLKQALKTARAAAGRRAATVHY